MTIISDSIVKLVVTILDKILKWSALFYVQADGLDCEEAEARRGNLLL
jgi:hypothetical protein